MVTVAVTSISWSPGAIRSEVSVIGSPTGPPPAVSSIVIMPPPGPEARGAVAESRAAARPAGAIITGTAAAAGPAEAPCGPGAAVFSTRNATGDGTAPPVWGGCGAGVAGAW
jgi:hypothetical protein